MIDFTIETEIARPPAEVFAYVTDPSKLTTWQTNTVSAEVEGGGPVRQGARLLEVHQAPMKRIESVVEVSRYEPDRAFDLRMQEGSTLPIHADIAFEPAGAGTRMRFRVHGEPKGVMRLMQPLIARQLRRSFASYCQLLKDKLET